MSPINHLENFDLNLEHDDGHEDGLISAEVIEATAREKLIFCADDSSDETGRSPGNPVQERVLEDCSYIWVDPHYVGQLSPGQQRTYEILLAIQQASVYCVTTVGKLAEAQGLANPLACCERLANLQSLGAIAGYKG